MASRTFDSELLVHHRTSTESLLPADERSHTAGLTHMEPPTTLDASFLDRKLHEDVVRAGEVREFFVRSSPPVDSVSSGRQDDDRGDRLPMPQRHPRPACITKSSRYGTIPPQRLAPLTPPSDDRPRHTSLVSPAVEP